MLYELYLVTNLITHKRYVGQVRQDIGFMNRWLKGHVAESFAPNAKHHCVFHASIKCYGPENFQVKRLMHNIEEKDIDRLERLWIQKLNTFYIDGEGYNMTLGGQGVHGYHHTEETKQKISKTTKGRKVPLDQLQKRKETLQLMKQSGYFEKRKNHTQWRERLSKSCKERYKHASRTFLGKEHTQESKNKIAKANGHAVMMIDKNTDKVLKIFVSGMAAGRYLNQIGVTTNKTPNGQILCTCLGVQKTAYGYKWKFYEEGVTTNPDECKDVGSEMSYEPKCATNK